MITWQQLFLWWQDFRQGWLGFWGATPVLWLCKEPTPTLLALAKGKNCRSRYGLDWNNSVYCRVVFCNFLGLIRFSFLYCRRILIDTGDSDVPQYVNHLQMLMKHENIDLAHIFITHWHHDHVGGLCDVLEIKENTSKSTELYIFKNKI